MFSKLMLTASLALMLGATVFGEDKPVNNVEVSVKGVMQEDKGGMFIVADGQYFDLVFPDDSSADMKKFHSSLEGDMVQVHGKLVVEKDKDGKVRLVVVAGEVNRMRGVRATETHFEPRVIETQPVYIERERERGIHLPGVHINW